MPTARSGWLRTTASLEAPEKTEVTRMLTIRMLLLCNLAMLGSACAADGGKQIPPVANVDLPRFMGYWYVIAHIPSRVERNAYNAVESYVLDPNGRVQTTFRYRNGSFKAPLKKMHPVGTVRSGTGNAIWGMQFIWPIKAEYVIVAVNEGYTQTIVGRSARDYAWIMARTPTIPETDYARHIAHLRELGYDVSKVRRVPQAWPE